MSKFIGKIMNGIEKVQVAFRFVRALEKGLIAFKAEFNNVEPVKEKEDVQEIVEE